MRTRRGMTLVELLAVVVILGLLAGTLMVGFSGTFGTAKHELAKTGVGLVVSKMEAYRIAHGGWPDTDDGLGPLSDSGPDAAYYLTPDQLLDPWGRPYLYIRPGPGAHPYEIVSYGADGQPGGEGEAADVSSVSLRATEATR